MPKVHARLVRALAFACLFPLSVAAIAGPRTFTGQVAMTAANTPSTIATAAAPSR
ncbi:MAG: hypothetical protein WCE79_26020 [Xanthobacteraceae bacterium]